MPSTPLACTLYRALHRSLRQINLSSGTGVLTLRLPVRTEAWGNSSTSYGSDKHDEAIKRYLGDLAQCAEPAFLKQEPSQVPPHASLTSETCEMTPWPLFSCRVRMRRAWGHVLVRRPGRASHAVPSVSSTSKNCCGKCSKSQPVVTLNSTQQL